MSANKKLSTASRVSGWSAIILFFIGLPLAFYLLLAPGSWLERLLSILLIFVYEIGLVVLLYILVQAWRMDNTRTRRSEAGIVERNPQPKI